MTLFAFLLVTISAFTHAFWNFLGKRQNPTAAFFLLVSVASVVVFSPVLFTTGRLIRLISVSAWGWILLTGAVQAVYYIFLAAAYRTGDLSHAYPLARSLPVVFVALASLLLGKGSQIQALAFVGFGLVSIGCLLLPLPKFSDIHPRHYKHKWVLFALLAALCITGYTLIDDQALRVLRSLQESAQSNLAWSLLYLELETISLTIFLAFIILGWRKERRSLREASRADWKTAWLMGFIITGTYGLVLLAMAHVSNVSYVMAFRQMSIPIGAAFGILFRKEAANLPKLVGIGIVVIGLVFVSIG